MVMTPNLANGQGGVAARGAHFHVVIVAIDDHLVHLGRRDHDTGPVGLHPEVWVRNCVEGRASHHVSALLIGCRATTSLRCFQPTFAFNLSPLVFQMLLLVIIIVIVLRSCLITLSIRVK